MSTGRHSGSHAPTIVETGEEMILFVDMIVIGATIMPGFLLCVPALALILVPVVALGLVAGVAVLAILLVTTPARLGWRAARRLRHAFATRRMTQTLVGASNELTRQGAGAGRVTSNLP